MVDENGVVSIDVPVLVAGLHRMHAAKELGMVEVDAFVLDGDENDSRLWEIAENLHRSDLTVQERADHVAEWMRITEEKLGQVDQVSSRRGVIEGRGNEEGISAASRDLGIDRNEARRAVKIASITPEARAAADDAGLNSQSARLEIAKAKDQVAQVQESKRRAAKMTS